MSAPNDGEAPQQVEASRANQELASGDLIGEYRVESKIGEGGFGCVYRVTHPVIGKTAAVKVLSLQCSLDPEMVNRFIDEARAVNQINHRNIIDIFSFGNLPDGRVYYVMEHLRGQPLDRYLRDREHLTPEQVIEILTGVARALDAAHARGIAHRDLKPENVFIVFEEDSIRVKLLDFGVAKLLGQSRQYKTQSGVPIGTSYYMSPEQCRGAEVDHRTDIYSLGVLTFELLTGDVPFDADSHVAVLIKHVSEEPPLLSQRLPSLPPALDAPLLRMLAKNPDHRPARATDALLEFAEAAQHAGFRVNPGQLKLAFGARTPAQLSVPTIQVDQLQDLLVTLPAREAAGTPAASVSAPRKPTQPHWFWVVLGVGAVAVSATLLVQNFAGEEPLAPPSSTTDLGSRPATERSPRPSAVTTPGSDTLSTGLSLPAQTSASGPSATPAPSIIELRINSMPPHVDVYSDTRKLGTAPGPLSLPHAEAPMKLTMKAKGYHSRTIEFTPRDNGSLSVTLDREKPRGSPAPHLPTQHSSGDLEF